MHGFDKFRRRVLALIMSDDTELLREIRDLLRLMAAPAIAERNQLVRNAIIQIVGKSKRKAEAVVLMDGTRTQAGISKECGIDMGHLSRLVKAMREAELIGADDKRPKTVTPLPINFLETFSAGKDE